eukprot:6913497-Pyramimonas_sp.AAC.1
MVHASTEGSERDYIMGKTDPNEKKFKLIVEVTKTQSPKYQSIASEIFGKLQAPKMTKSDA